VEHETTRRCTGPETVARPRARRSMVAADLGRRTIFEGWKGDSPRRAHLDSLSVYPPVFLFGFSFGRAFATIQQQ